MLTENTVSCHPSWVGVDVGKESLAVHIASTGEAQIVANRPAAIKAFLCRHPGATLVFEATGGHEAELATQSCAAGHTVYRVNARRVRAFMESMGIYTKTDAIDAKALADYAVVHARHLRPFALPAPEMKELKQYTRRRAELIALRTQELNRLQAPDNACLRTGIKAMLKCTDKQIAVIEERIAVLVEGSAELVAKVEVLTAVKGVGQTTAVKLLAAMPELGQLDGKQAAALAGLAPFARDSGKKKGYRRMRGGRLDARNALYMAALSATRYNAHIKTFYLRLVKNGKRPLQALLASARKLLVILNAKLRDAALIPASNQQS